MRNITTSFPIQGYWDTRQGGRPDNQDSYGCTDTPLGLLAVVCDGMGGGPGGKQASMLAVQNILEYVLQLQKYPHPQEVLEQAILQAHRTIVSTGNKYPKLKGMGSTVVAVLFHRDAAYIAHVGDSRVYQFRRGQKIFRTSDHSLVADMVRNGNLTEEQARLSSQSNILTKALGGSNCVVELNIRPYEKGDRFLLCTDGIWGAFEERVLVQDAAKTLSLPGAVDALVLSADELGRKNGNKHDNLTIALFETKQDSRIKEAMSRKTLLIIRCLAISCFISIIVNILLLMNFLMPKQEMEQIKQQQFLISTKDSLVSKLNKDVDSLKNLALSLQKESFEAKSKAADEIKRALEIKSEADERMRLVKQKEQEQKVTTKQKQSSNVTLEIKGRIEGIIKLLKEVRDMDETSQRGQKRRDCLNKLDYLIKKDPVHQDIYNDVKNKLNNPIAALTTDNAKGHYNILIKNLNGIIQ